MRNNSPHLRRGSLLGSLAGIVLLTLLIGVTQYRNTRQLVDSLRWVKHTEQVLSTLQLAEHAVGQISDDGLLFRATGREAYWEKEVEERVECAGIIARLATLVQDNPEQQALARGLWPRTWRRRRQRRPRSRRAGRARN